MTPTPLLEHPDTESKRDTHLNVLDPRLGQSSPDDVDDDSGDDGDSDGDSGSDGTDAVTTFAGDDGPGTREHILA